MKSTTKLSSGIRRATQLIVEVVAHPVVSARQHLRSADNHLGAGVGQPLIGEVELMFRVVP